MFQIKGLSKKIWPLIGVKSVFLGLWFSVFGVVFCANSQKFSHQARKFVQKSALQRLKTLENTHKILESVKEDYENMCLLRKFF
jgi:hypothetical protein